MIEEKQLLKEVFDFLVKCNYIQGEEESIRDMVMRYKHPPMTLYNRVVMQMTVPESEKLSNLLGRILALFEPEGVPLEQPNEAATNEPELA